MTTNIKINKHDDNFTVKVLRYLINEQELRVKSHESSYHQNRQKLKELEAKKPDDFKHISNPSPSFLKALQANRLKCINSYRGNMEDFKKEIELIRAKIIDNEMLLAVFIEYNFDFTIILQDKLIALKDLLRLAIDSVFYALRYYGLKSYCCTPVPTDQCQSLIDLIEAIMCELVGKFKKSASRAKYWENNTTKENYERCLEIEIKKVHTSLIDGKKIYELPFAPDIHDIPEEIERLNRKITDYNTSLGRQLYIWLYVTGQIILRRSLEEFDN